MSHVVLDVLVAAPAVVAVLAVLSRRDSVAVGLSVFGSLLVLAWSVFAVVDDRAVDELWIASLGVHWHLVLDGISAPLVLLTTLVTFCSQLALVRHAPRAEGVATSRRC